MTEKELGRILLQGDGTGTATLDPALLMGVILERARRRVRILAGVTIALWLVAAALLGYLLISFAVDFIPKQKQLQKHVAEGKLEGEKRQAIEAFHLEWLAWGARIGTIAVTFIAVAAIGTVVLISTTRRVTLRQINASLWDISEQLKRLREGHRPETGKQ